MILGIVLTFAVAVAGILSMWAEMDRLKAQLDRIETLCKPTKETECNTSPTSPTSTAPPCATH